MKHVYMIVWQKDCVVCNEYKTAKAAKKQIEIWCKGKNAPWKKQDHKIKKVRKEKLEKFYKKYII